MSVVVLEGSARARGEAHGESLRSLITEGLNRWRDLAGQRGQDPDDRIERLASRSPYVEMLARRFPDLLEEVRGISDAANVRFSEVMLLNLMDEEWWFREGEESGCSLVAGHLNNGGPVVAQNMDLPEWMDGLQTVLRIREHDADHESVVLSVAGMIGLTGMRSGGVAVGVNTLLQLPRSQHGVPVAFVVRSTLESATAEKAVGHLASLPHASGQHYAVADSRLAAGIECSAVGTSMRRFDRQEWLVHTNHPLWSDPALVAPPSEAGIVGVRLHSSHDRLDALARAVASQEMALHGLSASAAVSSHETGWIKELLSDTDSGVCMTASAAYPTLTFGSVLFSPGTGRSYVRPSSDPCAEWLAINSE